MTNDRPSNARMPAARPSNVSVMLAFVVVSVAVAGYFTGLQAPMKASTSNSRLPVDDQDLVKPDTTEVGVIPATNYHDMAGVNPNLALPTRLTSLKSAMNPLAEIKIDPQEKLVALQQREQNRAFNGAPPTIPHPMDQRSDAACVACHSAGTVTTTLRIPRMSHTFLANCTQCHVESQPGHMAASTFRDNSFVGLKAPTGGPRSFAGAPPQIPHSTWMRSDCMSCHGYAGRHGIRTTHPWRNNCQQCHAPSATMDQTLLISEPQFLPSPTIQE